MKRRLPGGSSLTELLVVVAVILILASMVLMGTGSVYSQAMRTKCMHNLEQIGTACQLYATQHRGLTLRSYNPQTGLRWYDALQVAKLLDNSSVLTCPVIGTAPGGGAVSLDPVQESRLPTLVYDVATGRIGSTYGDWDTTLAFRTWAHSSLPCDVIFAHGATNTFVPVTNGLLFAASQVWFLNTEYHDYKPGQNVFEAGELAAIKAFHDRGGGIMCWSEAWNYDDYYRSTNNIIGACADVGLQAGPIEFGGLVEVQIDPTSHPSLNDSSGQIRSMLSQWSPAKFWVTGNDPCAVTFPCTVGSTRFAFLAAWDNGSARLLLHGTYTSLISYGGWPGADVRRHCVASDKWLRQSGGLRAGGSCTYGYNNQLGSNRRTVAPDAIVVMDYNNWEIDRDPTGGVDDNSYVALRHAERANALMGDGSVRTLRLEDIKSGMWTPQGGD